MLAARGATDIGCRAGNEDAWLIDEETGLFIVADGMGGHERGEIASRFTSDQLDSIMATMEMGSREITFDGGMLQAEAEQYDSMMAYAVLVTNRSIFLENDKKVAEFMAASGGGEDAAPLAKKCRMGTTVVSLLIRRGRAWITHIGDSRAYRIAAGEIRQLTRDHSWVDEQVRIGALTPEQARVHKRRNVITRSVGFKPEVEADIDVLTIEPPERFLLCSDGLSNVIDEEMLLSLAQIPDLRQACEEMVSSAKDRGGKDNITAVLVEVDVDPTADGDELPFRDDTIL